VERQEDDIGPSDIFHGCATDLGAQLSEPRERRFVWFVHEDLDGKTSRVTPPANQYSRDATTADEPDPLLCVSHVDLVSLGV
jgi:predicted NAD/FAD-dependent oxidoreductase